MPLLILMQSSRTTRMTWSSQDTAMHCTSPNQRHAAEQADISSCPTTLPNHQTIAPSSQLHRLSRQSCPQRQRLRWGVLYINCREAMPACHILKLMGHPQPLTPMQMDNTTALDVVNNNVIKKLKAKDMKYHWLCDRESRQQFQHCWAPGKENNGNYVTKHHAAIHHQATCPTFLTNISTLQALHQQLTGNLPVASVC
jgi:hypothetical protein